MANPNIVNVSTINGNTAMASLTGASGATGTIVNNASGSNKIFKINSLYIANIDGTNSADITVSIHPQDDLGGTAVALASTVAVAADSTLVLITKDTAIYLLEDRSIGCHTPSSGDLNFFCSWDEIS